MCLEIFNEVLLHLFNIYAFSFFKGHSFICTVSIWLLLLKGKNEHHNYYLVWQKMKESQL